MREPLATVKEGQLKGKICEDIRGGKFYSFQGIPYAKPPVGYLRFKAPYPPERWEGVRDATTEGNSNIQKDVFSRQLIGSEDCLNLNVYTPQLPEPSDFLKPVMVFIHGGAFTFGSNKTDLVGPEYLVAEDIVLVAINYRLGYLGFLTLEDPSLGVTGNAAFKDMVMALRWVQQNIKQFGGDPNNVTLFGESAGGAAVHLIMLSPTAKGLFHKVIIQSASALSGWVYGRNTTKELCADMGFKSDDEKKLLEFLQNASAEDICRSQMNLEKKEIMCNSERHLGFVVEKKTEGAFLSDHPANIILSGDYNKVPMMMGYNSLEGLFYEMFVTKDKQNVYWTNREVNVPFLLQLSPDGALAKFVGNTIVTYYAGEGKEVTKETHAKEIYDCTTDNTILRGIYSSAKNQVKTNGYPIYFYRINLETELNIFKALTGSTIPGACHGDDVGYLFKTVLSPEIILGSIEDISQRRITKLWTNFAKYGNPTPVNDPLLNVRWKPVDEETVHYLNIDEELEMRSNPEPERMAFWDSIYKLTKFSSKL